MSNHTNDSPAAAPPISDACSLNFSVAKVLSIFMVLLGHWFTGTVLWVPVTFGLFVFAFSSAYFTAKIYGVELNRQRFWARKLERLGVRYWLIMLFLSIVMLAGDRPILHWHSLVHFMGLSGALNWLRIPNQSGLGAGLWFFTLLLLFYASYPLIAWLCRKRAGAIVVAVVASAIALLLEETAKVAHELWLTSLGFVVGVAYGLHERRVRSFRLGAAILLTCSLLVLLNAPLVGVKQLNTLLIMLISMAICVWLASRPKPEHPLFSQIARLDKYLLEIFLIHVYLFMHPTANTWMNLGISLSIIMLAAIVLHAIEARVSGWLFARAPVSDDKPVTPARRDSR